MSDAGIRSALMLEALTFLNAGGAIQDVQGEAERCASWKSLFDRSGLRLPAIGLRMAKMEPDPQEGARYAINSKRKPTLVTLEALLAMRNVRKIGEAQELSGLITERITDRLHGAVSSKDPCGFWMWAGEDYVYDEADPDLFGVAIRFEVPALIGN